MTDAQHLLPTHRLYQDIKTMIHDYAQKKGCGVTTVGRDAGVGAAMISRIMDNQSVTLDSLNKIQDFLIGVGVPAPSSGTAASTPARSVAEVIEAFKAGDIVVVTDDDDREGEGDLVIAASLCTPEKMAFIIRNTCGIVCTPLTSEDARRLKLDPMVSANDAPHGTAFTVTIDYKHGTTTGISADDRTATVRALANPNVGAVDFARPGHIFPLIARDGGVLMRSGHTEAAVDLCKLAGLPPVGVICELVNDDGTVMKGRQVADFAARHKLKHITTADLIAWRQEREKLVERVASFACDSPIGPLQGYAYKTPFDPVYHMAFVHGSIGDGKAMPARFHRVNIITDILGGAKSVHAALEKFRQSGRGVLIYLRDGAAGVPVTPIEQASSSEDARTKQWREVGVGAQILRDLGVSSINHLTNSQRSYVGLSGFGIEIVSETPFDA